ncbi:hypothetical protein [Bacillus solitudinis]|uniref:hypothetical protein n=1 Tax=Bacillus solitudinis TaxID=2014074 RepID=UPI000C243B75|nr:hypothetical protein [Bacillus solitudinis]
MKREFLVKSLLAMLIIIAFPLNVYAHKMIIEPIGENKVRVHYEDKSFSSRTIVQVLDEEGHLLFEERLDEKGHFDFGDMKEAHLLVADDGIGHRGEWVVGEEKEAPFLNKWVTVAVVSLSFIVIAWFFYQRTRSRTDKKGR